MTSKGYRFALDWIVLNDDTEWLPKRADDEGDPPSVTACLIADLFGKPVETVTRDLIRRKETAK